MTQLSETNNILISTTAAVCQKLIEHARTNLIRFTCVVFHTFYWAAFASQMETIACDRMRFRLHLGDRLSSRSEIIVKVARFLHELGCIALHSRASDVAVGTVVERTGHNNRAC